MDNRLAVSLEKACRRLAREVREEGLEGQELQDAKREVAGEYSLERFPSNSEVLEAAREMEFGEEVRGELQRKPTRSKSGVSVVAVMTSPAPCPHGRCGMCPGGPEEGTPQSYTGKEPAARRGGQNEYDPGDQVETRLEQFHSTGHEVDKVELIVMGGTFTARDPGYQRDFVKRCLDALNGSVSGGLGEAKRRNETAERRCVGMTLETRPDEIDRESLRDALEMGFTRVEMGIQSVRDDALRGMDRGHTLEEAAEAQAVLKDHGFKVANHWMPGFPGVPREAEAGDFRQLFSEDFQPDALKIYPSLVLEGTDLYEEWREGRYEPLSNEGCASLVADLLEAVPPWVRVKRVMRDIPSDEVAAGPTATNMRQLAWRELDERGRECRCIRCREVGRREGEPEGEAEPVRRSYRASGGREHFLSYEHRDTDALVGLLRLREPVEPPEELQGRAVVRELHVYGDMKPVGEGRGRWQHRSFGERLLERAEELAEGRGFDGIGVISGVGAREYYRGLGYSLEGPYVVKDF